MVHNSAENELSNALSEGEPEDAYDLCRLNSLSRQKSLEFKPKMKIKKNLKFSQNKKNCQTKKIFKKNIFEKKFFVQKVTPKNSWSPEQKGFYHQRAPGSQIHSSRRDPRRGTFGQTGGSECYRQERA